MSNNLRSRQYKGSQRKKNQNQKFFTLIDITPQYLFSLRKHLLYSKMSKDKVCMPYYYDNSTEKVLN